jgi:hypothetical protein
MGKLAVALVLGIEDAHEMFQQNNVLYVYVHVYACWVWTKITKSPFYVMGGVSPWRDDR